jgi:hypothetical protein
MEMAHIMFAVAIPTIPNLGPESTPRDAPIKRKLKVFKN